MEYKEVIKKLVSLKNPKNVEGMVRFGIRPKTEVLGIPIPVLRKMAKEIQKSVGRPTSHQLALKLWDSGIHEARILAGYIAEPEKITEKQFEKWVKSFDSWDVVDQVCSSVLWKVDFSKKKTTAPVKGAGPSSQSLRAVVFELAKRKEEFVKRTAFTLIACLSVHNKKMSDKEFLKFFPLIKKASIDERNFVKKAVNWALRQIGKRNKKLNKEALKLAKEIQKIDSKSARWVASNAIHELRSEQVQKRLK
ncbi:MAG: DNA alkylation repair protein [Candidatus Staskawiczbacteria bacterium]|nr:DNA alkylation repair protein [Candidatus Staskawiczbacteria bacterium]